MKRALKLVALLAVLTAVSAGTGCGRFEAREKHLTEVRVAPVTVGDFGEYIAFVGTLRATRRATVSAAQGGRVMRVDAGDGERVVEGQPLIWLETSDTEAKLREEEAALAGARAHQAETEASLRASEAKLSNDVTQAQQALRQADLNVTSQVTQRDANQRDMTRMRTLFDQKAVSRSQMEQAELKYALSVDSVKSAQSKQEAAQASLALARRGQRDVETQRAQLAGARAQVAQAEASVNEVRLSLQQRVLRAPMTGTVIDRSVEPGQVAGGGALLTVVDNSRLECITPIDERYTARIRRGTPAILSTALADAQRLKAEVLDVVASSDPKTSTVRVRLRILNPDNLLMDGLSINGRLPVASRRGPIVPREAVHRDGKKAYVAVVESQTVRRRGVTILDQDETHALLSGEVRAGEFVVVDGTNLVDGQPVKIDYTPPSSGEGPDQGVSAAPR